MSSSHSSIPKPSVILALVALGLVIRLEPCLYDHALAIARMENGQFGVTLASTPWMTSSLTHDVIVTDDGNQMQVFLDGSLALSAADSTRFARNFVTLADRPNEGWMNNSTQIDYVEIYTE